jgi:menaquinone-dependent protoporphyrinogen oxidase
MESNVLVAYATTHGSTREVAETVVATLRSHGLAVDLQPMRDVRSLEGYRAVVLGAPLYMFHLHRDAPRFLSHHRKALTGGLPIAVFAGGPFGSADGAIGDGAIADGHEWQEVRKQLDQELAKFHWLKPIAVEVIGGKFDPSTLRLPWSLVPALRKMPPSDLRDWDAIRRWASTLAAQLQPASLHSEEDSK